MKKLMIGFALMMVLALAVGVSAQDDMNGASHMQYGIKFGMGLFNATGSDVDQLFGEDISLDSKSGFSGGGFFAYPFSPQFAIQPEVLYVMKGAKTDILDETVKIKLTYVEIPVLFKYTIPTQGNFSPNLFAGPALSILTSAEISNSNESEDIKDFMKSTDLSIVFGGGFLVQMESFGIVFDVRYTMGITKTFDADKLNEDSGAVEGDSYYLSDDPDVKNKGISGHVGVSF